jgi:peptide/nickel transport system substrate-binding protein
VQGNEISPFVRLLTDRRSILTIGGCFLSFLQIACSSPQAANVRRIHASVATIAVAEGGDANAGEIGFQQIWPLLSFEGLIDHRALDGRARPSIAESWSESSDRRQWTFILRQDVLFHDGSRCDAPAVKSILDAALKRPDITLYPGLLDITSVEAVDDRRLVLTLRRPSAFLLDDLYIDIAKKSPTGEKIGTGPYRLTKRTQGEVTLEANARYARGAPRIKQLVFRSYPTLRQAWSSLLRDEIEGVWYLSGDALEFLTDQTVETFNVPRHYAYAMVFNSQRPQLREPAVRRALNSAIDREFIIKTVLKGRGRPAYTPIWPGHWAVSQNTPEYRFDPSLAKTTLGALSTSKKGGHPTRLQLKCLVPTNNAVFERLALVMQTELYNVGVDLQLEPLPLSQYDTRLRSGQYDAALIDLAAGPSLSRTYLFWRSPGEFKGLNVFGYHNVEVDRWLDRLRSAPDEATTRAAASQLQQVLLEDPPAVFVAWSERSRAVSRRINVGTAPGSDPFEGVWNWDFDDQRLARK